MRAGMVTMAIASCALAGACSSSAPKTAVPTSPTAGSGTTVTTLSPPADPGSSNPCDAISQSDVESIFGPTVGRAARAAGLPGTCRWKLVSGRTFEFAYATPNGAPRAADPLGTLQKARAEGGTWTPVTGAGDAAFVAPGAKTLWVVKKPSYVFTVGYSAGDPAATPTDVNRFKALANEFIATHSQ